MESYNELKEIHIKNRTCYDFDDIFSISGLILIILYHIQNYMKMF